MNTLKAPTQEVHQARVDASVIAAWGACCDNHKADKHSLTQSIEAFLAYRTARIEALEDRIDAARVERYLAERMVDQADAISLPYAMVRARKANEVLYQAVAVYYDFKAQERLS